MPTQAQTTLSSMPAAYQIAVETARHKDALTSGKRERSGTPNRNRLDKIRASLDALAAVEATPDTIAFGKISDKYNEAKYGPAKGAATEIIAREVPAAAGPVRIDAQKPVSVDAAPVPAVEVAAKKPTIAETLAPAIAAIQAGTFRDLDEFERTDYANQIVGSYLWDSLEIPEKAIVAETITVMETVTGHPNLRYCWSPHAALRAGANREAMPYRVEYLPKYGVMRCNCEAGAKRHDCWHAVLFVLLYGEEIESVYGVFPRVSSEAQVLSAVERGNLLADSGVMKAEDFG